MANYYFFASELADFNATSGASTAYESGTAEIRTSYARKGVTVDYASTTGFAEGWLSPPVSTLWCGFRMTLTMGETGGQGRPFFEYWDDSTLRLAVVMPTNSSAFQLVSYQDGVTPTVLATGTRTYTTTSIGAANKIDIFVDYKVAGRFKVYMNGALMVDYEGDVTGGYSTTLSRFRLRNPASTVSGNRASYSEVIASSRDTRLLNLVSLYPTGNGANSEWTGSYTAVNKTTTDEATYISSDTPDQVSSFATKDLPVGTSHKVQAVKVIGRAAQVGEGGPSHIQLGMAVSGSTAFGAEVPVDGSYANTTEIWTENPVTGQPFTQDDVNALELAVKSRP